MTANPLRLTLLAAVAGVASAIVSCEAARATVVTFDMVDVALFPGPPTSSIVVTTGMAIPGGEGFQHEFNISSLKFNIDGDANSIPDFQVRTATFSGGQIVVDGMPYSEVAQAASSFVVTKGENSYLNMPFLDGEVIGDELDEFIRRPPGANVMFSVALDEGGAVRWFQEGIDNFVGFRLVSGAYGWIRVQFDATASTLTFLDGAYDTTGTPMTAGSTVSGGGVSADFDGDLDVDGADYLTWQRGVGLLGSASFADGDANGDFNVDRGDLAYWKGQFAGANAVAAAGAVPEPAAVCLAICGVVLLCRGRHVMDKHR